jgi:rubredoxin
MYLTTCNNCGLVWDDPNPGKESIEYKVLPNFDPLGKDKDGYWCCPQCNTDGYLQDNINWNAMNALQQIVVRRKLGTDCTEEESAEIKGWLKETILAVNSWEIKLFEDIQLLFPLEFSESMDEIKAN